MTTVQDNAVTCESGACCAGSSEALPLLSVRDLRCGYGKKHPHEIVHGVNIDVTSGEFICILGPNGCGKTTTLKAMMGLLPLMGGSVQISGCDIARMNEMERARRFAYIPQAHTPPFPFSVADVVMMGRTPYVSSLSRPTDEDFEVALKNMQLLGIDGLAQRAYTDLSGGQQQLVLIARALCQESALLVMDEPTAALDFGNQHLVLSRMHMLSEIGKAVVMVTHDPNHALSFATRTVVMEKGVVIADGTPAQCVTTEVLQRIYGVTARVCEAEVEPGRRERVCLALA